MNCCGKIAIITALSIGNKIPKLAISTEFIEHLTLELIHNIICPIQIEILPQMQAEFSR